MIEPNEEQIRAAAEVLAKQDPNWIRLQMIGATNTDTLMNRYGEGAIELATAVLNADQGLQA